MDEFGLKRQLSQPVHFLRPSVVPRSVQLRVVRAATTLRCQPRRNSCNVSGDTGNPIEGECVLVAPLRLHVSRDGSLGTCRSGASVYLAGRKKKG